jgi:hypothetical protein
MAELPPLHPHAVSSLVHLVVEQLRREASPDPDVDADECYISQPEQPVLPPDAFTYDGVLRKGLGRKTIAEIHDAMRQHWLSLDDEHWRHQIDRSLRARPFHSDEPEPDSY